MPHVPIPVEKLELGKPLPVDVWAASGVLLLRKGQMLDSEHERAMLDSHQAAMTQTDARAWMRAYERRLQDLERAGASAGELADARLPWEIPEQDYADDDALSGGWLDLHELLQILLYQAQHAVQGAARLARIERRALTLLQDSPDASLFTLFQALADVRLGYCATHALLSAVVCELTARKLGIDDAARGVLLRSALVMNIGMARAQDQLAIQAGPPSDAQRHLIRDHGARGAEVLQALGVNDDDVLDIVRWHHAPDAAEGWPQGLQRRRLLHVADVFVAKLAARKTRLALSALGAARSMVVEATGDTPTLASAVATAVGFYPPGTYVQLVNGERAVVVARGARAHEAHVVSVVNAGGMPLGQYVFRDSTESRYGIRAPVNSEKIKLSVHQDKAFAAWSARPA